MIAYFCMKKMKIKLNMMNLKLKKIVNRWKKKKKENTGGIKLTSTLGKIEFTNKGKAIPSDDGEIVGLNKKKKKKKQNKDNK